MEVCQEFVRIFTGWYFLLKGREHENMVCPESQGETKLAKRGLPSTQPKTENLENNKR